MKRFFYSLYLLFSVIIGSIGATEWYSSTASGMLGSPIRGGGPDNTGWSLAIDHGEKIETRTLYRDGSVSSSTVFYRQNGRLEAREELDVRGVVISRVDYAYDSDGNPRAIFISVDGGSDNSTYVEADTNINPDGSFRRHIGGSEDEWRITDMDGAGRPVNRTILKSGAVVKESSWSRNDEGTLREEVHRSGDEEILNRYDSNGRLLEETTIRNGSVVMLRNYFWTGSKLIRVEERGEGRIVVREMEWSGDRMISETRSIDGVTAGKVVWESSLDRVETLFRDGQAVIRIYWRGDVRWREEFLRNGEVIRINEDGK